MDYDKFIFELRMEFPSFKVIPKSSSLFMKVLDVLLKIVTFGQQRTFLTSYVTTIGTKVYTPASWGLKSPRRRIAVLRHERVHMRQAKRYGLPLFAFLYILCPLPLGLAWCRARFEWEAYEESMRAAAEADVNILDDVRYQDSIIQEFVTGAYGWMWPFPRMVTEWYERSRLEIRKELGHDR